MSHAHTYFITGILTTFVTCRTND